MSNRRKDAPATGPIEDEPGPISFGAGPVPLADEPGPIHFGPVRMPEPPAAPSPTNDADDLDFASGPKIALPSYITRAAQRWNPDTPAQAKAAPAHDDEPTTGPAPPGFAPMPAFNAPADDAPAGFPPQPAPEPMRQIPPVVQAPRRPIVQRPEPTYPPPLRPQPAAEEPKRYFTPLPEAGPPPAASPPPEPALEDQPLIQIQIRRPPPLFKGNGLMRGLFFGCALGVAVGGIAAVLLDLIQARPAEPPALVLPKVVNAETVTIEPADGTAQARPKKGKRPPAKGYAKPDDSLDLDHLQTTIRVQSAPPPKPVLRSGSGQIQPDDR